MWARKNQSGFTIVELLIVIVVIAILATITVVAFNGVQDRAKATATAADFSNNNKIAQYINVTNGRLPSTVDVLQSSTPMVASRGIYKYLSYCASSTDYALAAETTSGNKYYSLNGAASVQNNSIDVTNACSALGISSANTIFLGMAPSSCAGENGTCTFSGTASVAYGSMAQGKFTAKKDLTSPVACGNTLFGDPTPGFVKACYVLQY